MVQRTLLNRQLCTEDYQNVFKSNFFLIGNNIGGGKSPTSQCIDSEKMLALRTVKRLLKVE